LVPQKILGWLRHCTPANLPSPYVFGGVKAGASNSNCCEDQTSTCKVTRGPHYDADATTAVPELYWK